MFMFFTLENGWVGNSTIKVFTRLDMCVLGYNFDNSTSDYIGWVAWIVVIVHNDRYGGVELGIEAVVGQESVSISTMTNVRGIMIYRRSFIVSIARVNVLNHEPYTIADILLFPAFAESLPFHHVDQTWIRHDVISWSKKVVVKLCNVSGRSSKVSASPSQDASVLFVQISVSILHRFPWHCEALLVHCPFKLEKCSVVIFFFKAKSSELIIGLPCLLTLWSMVQ